MLRGVLHGRLLGLLAASGAARRMTKGGELALHAPHLAAELSLERRSVGGPGAIWELADGRKTSAYDARQQGVVGCERIGACARVDGEEFGVERIRSGGLRGIKRPIEEARCGRRANAFEQCPCIARGTNYASRGGRRRGP
jgi:hypothetical protein